MAEWVKNTDPDDSTVTVTFMENAMVLGASEDYVDLELTLQKGETIGTCDLQPYVWGDVGYAFLFWSTTKCGLFPAGGYVNADEYKFDQPVTDNLTLYAVWQSTDNDDPDDTTVTVTFKENPPEGDGGDDSSAGTVFALTLEKGKAIGTFDLQPYEDWKGYSFVNWSTEVWGPFGDGDINAELYDFGQPVTEDLTLFAVWQSTGGTEEIKDTYSTVEATEHPEWVQQALYTYDTVDIYPYYNPDGYAYEFSLKSELTIPSGKTLYLNGQDDGPDATLQIIDGGKLSNLGTIRGDVAASCVSSDDDSVGHLNNYGAITGSVEVGSYTYMESTGWIGGNLIVNSDDNDYYEAYLSGTVEGTVTLNPGSLTISGGTIGDIEQTGGILTISGGTVGNVKKAHGILTITDGTVDNVEQTSGNLTISGGTVYGCDITGGILNVSGGIIDGDGGSAITMSGGTVTISGEAIIRALAPQVIYYTGGKLNLNGGLIFNEYNGYAVTTNSEYTSGISVDNNAKFLIGTYNNTESGTVGPRFLGQVDSEGDNYSIAWIDPAHFGLQERKWWSGPNPQ